MGIKYVLVFLLLVPFVSGSIRINEVFVEGAGKYEWVELYNYGSEDVNLTDWEFGDNQDNDTINGDLILEPNEYALLTSDTTYVYFLWDIVECNNLYVEGALGNALRDEGEDIYLYDNESNLVDSLSYPDLNGNIYALSESGDWNIIIDGTLGYANYFTEICDSYIDILLSKNIFEDETIYYTPKVYEAIDYTIEYWIEDLGGNIVRSKTTTTNSNQKQWTPSTSEEGTFIIKANITYLDCNDINLDNNYKEKLIVILKEEEFVIQDYSTVKINELFPDPEGSDTASMPSGEFVELYNSGSSTLDLENLSLKDNYGQNMDIFISDSNTFDTVIGANSYLVVYMNGRFGFLNNENYEKISLYKDDYLLDEVSYSGSSEGLTWSKVNDKWILSLPTPNSENFGNESDITISNLIIDRIYDLGSDNIAKFGQIIRIKLLVYKGDTNKESIKLYVEDENGERVSKESKVNVEGKFTNYTFTVPIQLIPNCKRKFDDGIYYIIVGGLDDTDKEEIDIEDITSSLCEVIKEYKGTVKDVYTSGSESVLKENYVTGSVVYEGESEKQEEYAVYFFGFSLVMLIVFLLWKNE